MIPFKRSARSLRAHLALEFYKLYITTETDDPSHRAAIDEADGFLAEIDRTAPGQSERSQALAPFAFITMRAERDAFKASLEAMEARADKADEDVAYWTGNSLAWQERVEAAEDKAEGMRVSRDAYAEMRDEARAERDACRQEVITEAARWADLQARVDAIDAAKAGEPPVPEGTFLTAAAGLDALYSWGRRGWDAAAALRAVDTKAITQATLAEQERIITVLRDEDRFTVYLAADTDGSVDDVWLDEEGIRSVLATQA